MVYNVSESAYFGYHIMTDRVVTVERVKAMRAGMTRLSQQRAKLEKIQRMRRALRELGVAARQRPAEACDAA